VGGIYVNALVHSLVTKGGTLNRKIHAIGHTAYNLELSRQRPWR